jgi:uncharacterized membrane protein YesL
MEQFMILLWIFIVSISIVFLLDWLIGCMVHYKLQAHQVIPEKFGLAFMEIHLPAARDVHYYGVGRVSG